MGLFGRNVRNTPVVGLNTNVPVSPVMSAQPLVQVQAQSTPVPQSAIVYIAPSNASPDRAFVSLNNSVLDNVSIQNVTLEERVVRPTAPGVGALINKSPSPVSVASLLGQIQPAVTLPANLSNIPVTISPGSTLQLSPVVAPGNISVPLNIEIKPLPEGYVDVDDSTYWQKYWYTKEYMSGTVKREDKLTETYVQQNLSVSISKTNSGFKLYRESSYVKSVDVWYKKSTMKDWTFFGTVYDFQTPHEFIQNGKIDFRLYPKVDNGYSRLDCYEASLEYDNNENFSIELIQTSQDKCTALWFLSGELDFRRLEVYDTNTKELLISQRFKQGADWGTIQFGLGSRNYTFVYLVDHDGEIILKKEYRTIPEITNQFPIDAQFVKSRNKIICSVKFNSKFYRPEENEIYSGTSWQNGIDKMEEIISLEIIRRTSTSKENLGKYPINLTKKGSVFPGAPWTEVDDGGNNSFTFEIEINEAFLDKIGSTSELDNETYVYEFSFHSWSCGIQEILNTENELKFKKERLQGNRLLRNAYLYDVWKQESPEYRYKSTMPSNYEVGDQPTGTRLGLGFCTNLSIGDTRESNFNPNLDFGWKVLYDYKATGDIEINPAFYINVEVPQNIKSELQAIEISWTDDDSGKEIVFETKSKDDFVFWDFVAAFAAEKKAIDTVGKKNQLGFDILPPMSTKEKQDMRLLPMHRRNPGFSASAALEIPKLSNTPFLQTRSKRSGPAFSNVSILSQNQNPMNFPTPSPVASPSLQGRFDVENNVLPSAVNLIQVERDLEAEYYNTKKTYKIKYIIGNKNIESEVQSNFANMPKMETPKDNPAFTRPGSLIGQDRVLPKPSKAIAPVIPNGLLSSTTPSLVTVSRQKLSTVPQVSRPTLK